MRIALLWVLIASVGCKNDDAPTCSSVVDKIAPILVPEMRHVAKADAAEIRSNLAGTLVGRCRDDRWSSKALACMRDANSELRILECSATLGADASSKLRRVLAIADLRLPPVPINDPSTGIPECDEYKLSIDQLAVCDAIPEATRKVMKDSFDDAADAWKRLPPEGKIAAASACKAAAKATQEAADSCR